MRRHRLLGPLGIRFAAAFVAVALSAIAVFAVAVLIADQGNVSHLAATDRDRTAGALVALARSAHATAGGWPEADLRPVAAFVEQAGIGVDLRDEAGRMVLSVAAPAGPGPSDSSKPSEARMVHAPVTAGDGPDGAGGIDGSVGSVDIAFPAGGLDAGDRHLRSALSTAVAWSAGFAVVGALIVGVVVARGVVRPIRRLSTAVRSVRLGGSSPRIGPRAGPGELGDLGRAFDAMAASLEHEDQLRRALVADVAHELRTPVAILQAETEALADGMMSPSPEALSSLHEEAVRLGRMVEDLQTLASAEAAGLELHRRPLDLGRVAADAADSLASRFRAAAIGLQQDLPPTPVLGDPRRLHQVVTNLLANAAKYTPEGGRVTLRTRVEGRQSILEVADNGPGIPAAERPLVWERFYRGRSGPSADGSGIGLAVVKELVDAHGGQVTVDEAPGGGALFVVRLPYVTAATAGADLHMPFTPSPPPARIPRLY